MSESSSDESDDCRKCYICENDDFVNIYTCEICKKFTCINCVGETSCQTADCICSHCYDYKCENCDNDLDPDLVYVYDGGVSLVPLCYDCKKARYPDEYY